MTLFTYPTGRNRMAVNTYHQLMTLHKLLCSKIGVKAVLSRDDLLAASCLKPANLQHRLADLRQCIEKTTSVTTAFSMATGRKLYQ